MSTDDQAALREVRYPSLASRLVGFSAVALGGFYFCLQWIRPQPHDLLSKQALLGIMLAANALARKLQITVQVRAPRDAWEQQYIRYLRVMGTIGALLFVAAVVWLLIVRPSSSELAMVPLLCLLAGVLMQGASTMLFRQFIVRPT